MNQRDIITQLRALVDALDHDGHGDLRLPTIDWDALPKTSGGSDVQFVAWDECGLCFGYARNPNINCQCWWATHSDGCVYLPQYDLPPFSHDGWMRAFVRRPPHAFRVDKPGIYRDRRGRIAVVIEEDRSLDYRWSGTDGRGLPACWTRDGRYLEGEIDDLDIIAYIGPLEPAVPVPDWSQIPRWLGNHVRWDRWSDPRIFEMEPASCAKAGAWLAGGRSILLPSSVCPRLPQGVDWRTAKADRPEGEQV